MCLGTKRLWLELRSCSGLHLEGGCFWGEWEDAGCVGLVLVVWVLVFFKLLNKYLSGLL